MTRIDLMVAGAAKCGTSSLIRYLGQHSGMCIHNEREFGFFAVDELNEQGFQKAFDENFQCNRGEVVAAKSVQILYSEEAKIRLMNHNPRVHLAVVLRDPVKRAYSDFCDSTRKGLEDQPTFEQAVWANPVRFGEDWVRSDHTAYLDRGDYAKYIGRLAQYFPMAQIHIYTFEDFIADPQRVCRQLWGLFPSLDSTLVLHLPRAHNQAGAAHSKKLAQITHSRLSLRRTKRVLRRVLGRKLMRQFRNQLQGLNEYSQRPDPMSDTTREALREYYRNKNEELTKMIDINVSAWRD